MTAIAVVLFKLHSQQTRVSQTGIKFKRHFMITTICTGWFLREPHERADTYVRRAHTHELGCERAVESFASRCGFLIFKFFFSVLQKKVCVLLCVRIIE